MGERSAFEPQVRFLHHLGQGAWGSGRCPRDRNGEPVLGIGLQSRADVRKDPDQELCETRYALEAFESGRDDEAVDRVQTDDYAQVRDPVVAVDASPYN